MWQILFIIGLLNPYPRTGECERVSAIFERLRSAALPEQFQKLIGFSDQSTRIAVFDSIVSSVAGYVFSKELDSIEVLRNPGLGIDSVRHFVFNRERERVRYDDYKYCPQLRSLPDAAEAKVMLFVGSVSDNIMVAEMVPILEGRDQTNYRAMTLWNTSCMFLITFDEDDSISIQSVLVQR